MHLAELLGLSVEHVKVSQEVSLARGRVDALIEARGYQFLVEFKRSGSSGSVAGALEQLRRFAGEAGKRAIPLVVVPYMGEAGKRLCEERRTAWLDLSGNARIEKNGLHVWVEGRPNRFKRPGRPQSAFAPKSSRIARWLLMHPGQAFTQRELSLATGIAEGFTSKIVAKLEAEELLVRDEHGRVAMRDPAVMLEAWREDYDFDKHHLIQGHIPARSGDALVRELARALSQAKVEYAATGLAGAWLLTQFAGFRLTTVYVEDLPGYGLLDKLGFREEPRGGNVWLALPKDEGVFHGVQEVDGVRCAHPVQVYVDLKGHPERAAEAAERVRSEYLRWRKDA